MAIQMKRQNRKYRNDAQALVTALCESHTNIRRNRTHMRPMRYYRIQFQTVEKNWASMRSQNITHSSAFAVHNIKQRSDEPQRYDVTLCQPQNRNIKSKPSDVQQLCAFHRLVQKTRRCATTLNLYTEYLHIYLMHCQYPTNSTKRE